jgi:hypothetical protein
MVKNWLGLSSDNGEFDTTSLASIGSLAGVNDNGGSFGEIADIIESNPPGLFKEATS